MPRLLKGLRKRGRSFYFRDRRRGKEKEYPLGRDFDRAVMRALEMERRINDGLLRWTPKAFFRRPRRLAIDLHQRPYYGRRKDVPVRGGKPKKGTKWFWTWATATVVEHGRRWTVAMTPVGPGDALEDVLTRLLDHVERARILVKMALVDREFYAARVIGVLQSRGVPFLMPAIRRRQLQGPKGPTGTQRFFQPGTAGFFEHSWTTRGKSNGQLGEGLAQTTTKRIAWRMLLVAVALLLRNLWVWRNQHTHHGPVTLSLQLHQLNIHLSRELDVILDFEINKT